MTPRLPAPPGGGRPPCRAALTARLPRRLSSGSHTRSTPTPRSPRGAATPFSALHNTSQSAFVDIAPLLIVSLESLSDLNGRLSYEGKNTVAIEQFRPNVVIEGVDAFAEESAQRMEIGAVGLTQLLPCERCSVTTFDVSTESDSEAKPSKEPLKTLSQYRNGGVGYAGGVTFGAYFAPESDGMLQVGDEIKVVA